MSKRILVFGATGQIGGIFTEKAIKAGHTVVAFVRNKSKFKFANDSNVEVIEGNATDKDAVTAAMANVDIVISGLGNSPKSKVFILEKAYSNIIEAAEDMANPPRCILISSIGIGGSSPFVKFLLTMIAGKGGIEDFEKAEKQVLNKARKTDYLIVRASGLTNNEEAGEYKVNLNKSIFWPKFISRSDVAQFFLDAVEDKQYDKSAIMLTGK